VTRFSSSEFATALQLRSVAKYVAQLIFVGAGYFVLAKAALTLASIYVVGLIVPWFMPETRGKPLPG